jgi:signal transduction histidine kinase
MTATPPADTPLAHARILVVEDEAIIAADIEQTLRGLGYAVVGSCRSADEAVDRALAVRPDLVLMDIRLHGPGDAAAGSCRDGIDAARRIRERLDVPIVFLTALADEETLQRAQSSEPYGYVLKPFDDRDLQVATTMALCKHRAFALLDDRVRARTDELMRSEARSRQLAAVAELGLYALGRSHAEPLIARAVATIADLLAADRVEMLERVPGGRLVVRGAAGAADGATGQEVDAGPGSVPGHTVALGELVIVDDLAGDDRFTPAELARTRAGSAVGVPVLAPTGIAWGVVAVYWRDRHGARAGQASFVQAVANVVATALARLDGEAQRLAAERQAEEARVRAAHADDQIRLRDEFLSIASHELKTPLTSLLLQLQALVDRPGSHDDRTRARLARATRSGERLAGLVDTLLDVSRLTSGAVELRLEDLALDDLVGGVVERLRGDADRAGCVVHLEIDGAARGRWDRLRLEQVVTNLLVNAFKYGAGQPVTVAVATVGDRAEIRVTDLGIGIPADDVRRIFDRFERAVSSQHYGGLGLGLYVARHLVEAHGGMIVVDSAPSAGATFIVRIPLDLGAEEPSRPPNAQELH